MKEFPQVDWSREFAEFIRAKTFELELERDKELQRSFLEMLASKSKLSKKEAKELGDRINRGMLEQLKKKDLV